jgi:hypothetical protein
VTITQEADFIALSKSAFSKDYPSFLQLMADTFEYELSQLSSSLWPPVWQPLKRALETPLWLSHINPEILERCHIWMGALRRALDKAPRKPHLVQQWSDLWDKLRSHQKISTLREAHPFWLIAIEGLVALFDETQTPFFPWSEKKIISALEKKELW